MRINKVLNVTSGAPLNILTGLATAAAVTDRVLATRVVIQLPHGTSGLGYAMDGIPPGVLPVASNPAHVTLELSPASANAPGGFYSDADPAGIDLSRIWVDVSVSGNVRVSYDLKV